MSSLQTLLDHVGPFTMALSRLAGVFVFAPVLGSPLIPARVRALLAVVFTLAIYPTVPAANRVPIDLDVFSLALGVVSESLIGVTIGLFASMPMYAAQLGGLVMGQQVGLGLANVYNPALDIEADVFGQMFLYMAMAAFIALGGLDAMFLALAHTLGNVPLGSFVAIGPDFSALDVFIGLIVSGFQLALRVAAPVLCIILLETLASSLLMKSIPQINIMSIGFAVKIVAAFTMLIAGIVGIGAAIHEDATHTCFEMLDFASSVGVHAAQPTPTP